MSLANYRFAIEIDSRRIGAFTECTLPSIEWDVEQIQEGGLNSFVHQLPKGRKQSKLTLKRGLGDGRELLDWYMQCLQGKFIRRNVTVHLIGYQKGVSHTAFSWTAMGAYPTKWTGPQLQSSGKAVAIETLEMACNEVVVDFDASFLQGSDMVNRFRNAQASMANSKRRTGGSKATTGRTGSARRSTTSKQAATSGRAATRRTSAGRNRTASRRTPGSRPSGRRTTGRKRGGTR